MLNDSKSYCKLYLHTYIHAYIHTHTHTHTHTPAGNDARLERFAELQTLDVGLREGGGVRGRVLDKDLHRQRLYVVSVCVRQARQGLELHTTNTYNDEKKNKRIDEAWHAVR